MHHHHGRHRVYIVAIHMSFPRRTDNILNCSSGELPELLPTRLCSTSVGSICRRFVVRLQSLQQIEPVELEHYYAGLVQR